MARYRRFRKGATQFARASYSEVYDMHTEVGKTTLIGIHTPVTRRWQGYLDGFCKQYQKFRYRGASISFVPVTTLPADPLQVSYEAGDETIDPRDLMNPIIHCGMRGQSLGNYLDEIFRFNISESLNALDVVNVSQETDSGWEQANQTLEECYYTALSSPVFRKSHIQAGFRKTGLHPMVYELSTNTPHNFAGGTVSYGELTGVINTVSPGYSTFGERVPLGASVDVQSDTDPDVAINNMIALEYLNKDGTKTWIPQYFTSRCHPLGWLDTLQFGQYTDSDGKVKGITNQTSLPKVYMYFIMLPPAYKTEMYFRVVIRHNFEFQGFRPLTGPFSYWSNAQYPYDGMIQNDPIEQSVASLLAEREVATMDIYNGDASLVSDGAM